MVNVDAARRPLTRDHTQTFIRHRRKARRKPQSSRGGQFPGTESLLAEEDPALQSPSRDRASLPPQWVDFADKAREEIRELRDQLSQLTKAQQRRLGRSQGGGVRDGPDQEVELLSSSIATLVRCCEQSIHQVRTSGVQDDSKVMDDEFRQNMQHSLAAELQQISQQCRQSQKEYLKEVERRQKPQQQAIAPPAVEDIGAGSGEAAADSGFGGAAMAQAQVTDDLAEMEAFAATRSTEIAQVAASIAELHSIFKDLAALVIDQGTILDRIDYNTERIYKKSADAKGQMTKAVKKKKVSDSRTMKCFIFWGAADVLLLLIWLVKCQIKYGLLNVLYFILIVGTIVGGAGMACYHFRPSILSRLPSWAQAFPELPDPKSLWRKFRPGPINTMKAAGAMSGATGGLGGGVMRPPGR